MEATTVLVSLLTRIGARRAAGTTWRRLVVSLAASRRATDTACGLLAGAACAPRAAPVIRTVVRTVATSICRVRCIISSIVLLQHPVKAGYLFIRYQARHGFHALV